MASLKIVHLTLALTSFGGAMAILASDSSASGYCIAAFNLCGTVLMIWQGRLWK